MSLIGKSFLSSKQLSDDDLQQVFNRATIFKEVFESKRRIDHLLNVRDFNLCIALVFAEPSTRTRTSFQIAAQRLGLRTVLLDNPAITSLQKGETFEDTLKNVAAMKPDLIVTRYGVDKDADQVLDSLGTPVVNAGIGTMEHPTQALLDCYTILECREKIKGEKVLIVGDVLHSRVANSNLPLMQRLGAEVAYCAPEEFVPRSEGWKGVRAFTDLTEGFRWATVVMGLRIQKERHGQQGIGLTVAEYRDRFRIGGDHLKEFVHDGILLHPGPVNKGVEISQFALNDPRCRILDQVANGVFIRAALLSCILGLEVQRT
ncbi:MAG: aspartate carbamoyltransferase catalytic subunit [Bdellovibrionales bacterium]|nr:aspartate carbamoyltransferase catalytic subunit [Bdellovibrionales bacterium]